MIILAYLSVGLFFFAFLAWALSLSSFARETRRRLEALEGRDRLRGPPSPGLDLRFVATPGEARLSRRRELQRRGKWDDMSPAERREYLDGEGL